MKSMLYVGATLMIGASIYGFVDYKQTQNKKEFKEMYSEKKPFEAPIVAKDEVTVPATDKKVAQKTKVPVTKKKSATMEDKVVGIVPISTEDKLVTEKTSLTDEPAVTITPSEESSVLKTVKKKKKIRKEYFSRGRMVEEEIPVSKKEIKKTESKEL
ncbi:MAG TPA: hypothetical protein VMZ03_01490 [Chitinophagaceae bacterium]|nr:hypothetical protein [Chitinophagaceae bacterium]